MWGGGGGGGESLPRKCLWTGVYDSQQLASIIWRRQAFVSTLAPACTTLRWGRRTSFSVGERRPRDDVATTVPHLSRPHLHDPFFSNAPICLLVAQLREPRIDVGDGVDEQRYVARDQGYQEASEGNVRRGVCVSSVQRWLGAGSGVEVEERPAQVVVSRWSRG